LGSVAARAFIPFFKKRRKNSKFLETLPRGFRITTCRGVKYP
jgi:hypothetical protein